ncbi:MAG: PKD domain-containing protein [Candidatus Anammoxibacter sp.]
MVFKLKDSFIKHFPICPPFFLAVLFFFLPIYFAGYDLLAQETIIEKSTNLLINKEVIEILQVKDTDGFLLDGKPITVTVVDPDIATISILDFVIGKDLTINEGSLIAQTDGNGRKAFIIKGVAAGKTKITFKVTSENDFSVVITEELNVNVIDLVAKIAVDKDTGKVPLTVQFFNDAPVGVDAVKWDFNDGSAISTEQNPEHTFPNSGTFNVTLEVTQTTNFGTVKDKTNVPIFVSLEGAVVPGIIFGTVFDLVANIPLNGARVVLLTTEGEEQQATGRDGGYRFENVAPGNIILTACEPLFFECIAEEINYDGNSLLKRFELKRGGFFAIPTTPLP